MRIIADLDRCIGSGQCVHNAARFFDQDDDTGLVIPPEGEIPPDALEEIEQAIYACPTRALRLED